MAEGEQHPAAGDGAESRDVRAELAGADEASSALVFRAFLNAMRLHRQLMMKTLMARGANPGQAFCLRLLAAHEGISQRDLAEMLHLARPTVTRMLQAIEKSGMVERRPDAADQRLTRVYLTAAGRDRERAVSAIASDYVDQTIGTLPAADRRELTRLLGELAESLSRALAAGDEPARDDIDAAGGAAGQPRQPGAAP
jgi:MarR family transcriptional regulator, organic hydroperoxide resistance regulator